MNVLLYQNMPVKILPTRQQFIGVCVGGALLSFGLVLLAVGLFPFMASPQGPVPASAAVTPSLLNFEIDKTLVATSTLPANKELPYRLIIPSIKVDMPIIINEKNETKALAKGAWLIPGTARPGGKIGYNNTVISAHRYMYTSGPKTFYNLDKVKIGDTISVMWNGKTFNYIVSDTAMVKPSAVYILNPTKKQVLTLFTCTPVFTTKNRLVVRAVLQ